MPTFKPIQQYLAALIAFAILAASGVFMVIIGPGLRAT